MTHPQNPTRTPNAADCSCGAWWTGGTRSHCAAPGCHRTFSGETAADRHRQGRFGIDRRCVDPATVGLVPVDKPYGVLWQNPAPEAGSLAAWTTRHRCDNCEGVDPGSCLANPSRDAA